MAFVRLMFKATTIEKLRRELEDEKMKASAIRKGQKVHFTMKQKYRHFWIDLLRRIKKRLKKIFYFPRKSCMYRTMYKLKREGSCENFTLKSIIGFIGGFFLTYIFFMFFVFQLNFKLSTATIMCSFFGSILTLGLAFSYKVRCVVFLLLPIFFSKRGRQALMAYAFILAITGPAKNTLNNMGILSESLACGQEQLKAAVRQILEVIKKPFYAIRDAIRTVVKTVKVVVLAIKEILLTIKRVILAILRVIKAAFQFLGKLLNICNKELGTPFERCTRVFEDAITDCNAKLGPLFNWLCSITYLVQSVCYIVKVFDFICMIVEFISDSIIGVVIRKIKIFVRHIKTMFYVRIKFSHSFHFETNQSKSYSEITTGIVTEMRERTEHILTVFDFMSCATSMFFLFIILRALNYRYKFLTSEIYDNRFINKNFRAIDMRRAQLEKETVLPLNHRELAQYITVDSIRLIKSERRKLSKSAVALGVITLKLSTHMMADYALYWVLTLIRYHSKFQSTVHAPNVVGLHIEGKGFIANLLKGIVKAFKPLGIHLEIDTVPCLPDPIPPDYDRYIQIVSLLVLCWILTIFEPYGLRLRHSVMCFYHPARARQRAVWLYNHILRSRSSFLKFARRQLRRKVTGEKGIAKITLREYVRAQLIQNIKLCRLCLSDDKQLACLLCGEVFRESDQTKPIRCAKPGCVGIYCEQCFADLQNLCTVCMEPIQYGDLSDISEEKDSSEDEIPPQRKKRKRKKCVDTYLKRGKQDDDYEDGSKGTKKLLQDSSSEYESSKKECHIAKYFRRGKRDDGGEDGSKGTKRLLQDSSSEYESSKKECFLTKYFRRGKRDYDSSEYESSNKGDSDYSTGGTTTDNSYTYQNKKNIRDPAKIIKNPRHKDVEKQRIPDYATLDDLAKPALEDTTDDSETEKDNKGKAEIPWKNRVSTKGQEFSNEMQTTYPSTSHSSVWTELKSKQQSTTLSTKGEFIEDIPLASPIKVSSSRSSLGDVSSVERKDTSETETSFIDSPRGPSGSSVDSEILRCQKCGKYQRIPPLNLDFVHQTSESVPVELKAYLSRFNRNIKFETVNESPTSSAYSSARRMSAASPRSPLSYELCVPLYDRFIVYSNLSDTVEDSEATKEQISKLKDIQRSRRVKEIVDNRSLPKQTRDSMTDPITEKQTQTSSPFTTSNVYTTTGDTKDMEESSSASESTTEVTYRDKVKNYYKHIGYQHVTHKSEATKGISKFVNFFKRIFGKTNVDSRPSNPYRLASPKLFSRKCEQNVYISSPKSAGDSSTEDSSTTTSPKNTYSGETSTGTSSRSTGFSLMGSTESHIRGGSDPKLQSATSFTATTDTTDITQAAPDIESTDSDISDYTIFFSGDKKPKRSRSRGKRTSAELKTAVHLEKPTPEYITSQSRGKRTSAELKTSVHLEKPTPEYITSQSRDKRTSAELRTSTHLEEPTPKYKIFQSRGNDTSTESKTSVHLEKPTSEYKGSRSRGKGTSAEPKTSVHLEKPTPEYKGFRSPGQGTAAEPKTSMHLEEPTPKYKISQSRGKPTISESKISIHFEETTPKYSRQPAERDLGSDMSSKQYPRNPYSPCNPCKPCDPCNPCSRCNPCNPYNTCNPCNKDTGTTEDKSQSCQLAMAMSENYTSSDLSQGYVDNIRCNSYICPEDNSCPTNRETISKDVYRPPTPCQTPPHCTTYGPPRGRPGSFYDYPQDDNRRYRDSSGSRRPPPQSPRYYSTIGGSSSNVEEQFNSPLRKTRSKPACCHCCLDNVQIKDTRNSLRECPVRELRNSSNYRARFSTNPPSTFNSQDNRNPECYCECDRYEMSRPERCTRNLMDDEISYISGRSGRPGPPEFPDLVYQNTDEFLDLVNELGDTLSLRNKERVERTIREFEHLSRQNLNLERPIFDDDSDDQLRNQCQCCLCKRANNKKYNSDEPDQTKFTRFEKVKTCPATLMPRPNAMGMDDSRQPCTTFRMSSGRWQLDPRTGKWYKVRDGFEYDDEDDNSPPLYPPPPPPPRQICMCDRKRHNARFSPPRQEKDRTPPSCLRCNNCGLFRETRF